MSLWPFRKPRVAPHGGDVGVRPATPKPLPPAAPGKPGDMRATELRRLIVQALAQAGWSASTLDAVAVRLLHDVAPEQAMGALEGVRAAFLFGEHSTRLRLQLIGALAVPGWRLDQLSDVGVVLFNRRADLGRDLGDLGAALGFTLS